MSSFRALRGAVMVGGSATEDERISGGEHLYHDVAFIGDSIALRFSTNGGQYCKISPEAFHERDGKTYFYPYHNETSVTAATAIDTQSLSILRDNVLVEAISTSDGPFIRSQNEVPAYTPNYLIVGETLYRIRTQMFSKTDTVSPEDEFLGLDSVEEPVYVENMETGAIVPLTYDRVDALVSNDQPNGALKIQEPDAVREITNLIEDNQ